MLIALHCAIFICQTTDLKCLIILVSYKSILSFLRDESSKLSPLLNVQLSDKLNHGLSACNKHVKYDLLHLNDLMKLLNMLVNHLVNCGHIYAILDS